ncbi:MAG: MFS transporter, partial [Desulfobulbaceae bacterium]|nr:MFS transporter [Desulfobulbaceae bacterium]
HIGYIFSMTIGAVVYDPGTVNRILGWLGMTTNVTQQMSMRYPIYLTLGLGFLALFTILGMKEPKLAGQSPKEKKHDGRTLREAGRLVLQAGKWMLQTPFVLAVILFAMTFDHILRMIVTMTSQYYRLIDLPEASFGLLGSAVALLGLVVPRLARSMSERFTPGRNVVLLAGISMAALWGLTWFIPYLGLLPMMLVFVGMMLTSFFTSHYLNQITESHQRATVLSFKGLAFNAAYGMIGILYAGLIQHLRQDQQLQHLQWSAALIENEVFRQSIGWFPWYMSAMLIFIALVCLPRLRGSGSQPKKVFNFD